MAFEWDESKNEANIRKYGISFEAAFEVFAGPVVFIPDVRRLYGEDRWIVGGHWRGRMVVTVVSRRGPNIRIISMRKANPREKKKISEKLSQL